MLGKILDGLIKGMAVLAGLILLFITFSISYGITTRAFGIQSPVWTVQFNEYSLLWMTFLGYGMGPEQAQTRGDRYHHGQAESRCEKDRGDHPQLMGIGVCAVLGYFSFLMVLNLYQRGVMDVQAVDIPKSFIVFIIPFGFFFLTMQFLRNLVTDLRRTGPAGESRRLRR